MDRPQQMLWIEILALVVVPILTCRVARGKPLPSYTMLWVEIHVPMALTWY